jgi:hypothetical protein
MSFEDHYEAAFAARPGEEKDCHLMKGGIPSSTPAAILSKTPALSHRAILRRNSPDTPSRSVCTTSPTDLTSVCSRNWQTDADSPNAEADHPSSGPGFCPGNRPPSPAVYLMEDRRRQDRVRVVHLCHLGGFGRE